MKKLVFIFGVLGVWISTFGQNNVAINETGADPHPSAMLDVSSTNKGVLIPRMTAT